MTPPTNDPHPDRPPDSTPPDGVARPLRHVEAMLLDVDAIQARRHAGTEAFRCLGDNIRRHGILQPLGVKPAPPGRWRVIFGNGRALVAKALGMTQVPVVVLGDAASENEAVLQLVENMLRDDLSPYLQWQGVSAALRRSGCSLTEMAAQLSLDPSSLTRILSPERCGEAVREALRAGKVNLTQVYAISKVGDSPAEQERLLGLALKGCGRDGLEAEVRSLRRARATGGQPAAKVSVSRVSIPLPTGVRVVVRGPSLDLDGVIAALTSALQGARQGSKENLDVRTFEKVAQDKAKA